VKHLTDEQKRIWNKYYCWLDADRLLLVTTNCFYYGKPTGRVVSDRLVPGVIWRNQISHRQAPEPANEEMDKALERLYSEGRYSKPLQFLGQVDKSADDQRPGWERYREYNDKNDDPLGRYIEYHPLVIRRIKELAEPVLYGQREDVQALLIEYQAGNTDILPRIKNQLGGITYRAQRQFSYIGNKEAFTNLAGKFNKKIPKPEGDYSENSPVGDAEEQRLMLITEPFNFNEVDLQAAINRSLTAALASYRPNRGAKFKTFFYGIFEKKLIDLYREYRRGWKHGHIISSYEELRERLQNNTLIDYMKAAEILKPVFMELLTDNQIKWIALFINVLPDRLTVQLTADVLNVSLKTEYNIRRSLQALLESNSAVLKHYRELLIIERSRKKKLKKQPAFNRRQLIMLKQYKDFISKPGYKPGICRGSSFFPKYVIITDKNE